MKARIRFRKYGIMRFIGHLDVMRYFQKAMRRADIPIAFTGGYSPHMIMSFAQPLGVGITSDGEYLDVELTSEISSQKAVSQLNAVMTEGIEVVSFVKIPDDKKCSGMTIVAAARYRITLLESRKSMYLTEPAPEDWKQQAGDFLAGPEILVMKKTKRSEKEVDIRPMIYEMELKNGVLELLLAAGSEENLKPDLVMDTFLRFMGKNPEEIPYHIHRVDIYAKSGDGKDLAALDELGEVME